MNAQLFQVEACNLFVQNLRQGIDNASFVLETSNSRLAGSVEPQVDLCDGLVGEACGHHEAGVAGSAAQVQETAFMIPISFFRWIAFQSWASLWKKPT